MQSVHVAIKQSVHVGGNLSSELLYGLLGEDEILLEALKVVIGNGGVGRKEIVLLLLLAKQLGLLKRAVGGMSMST